MNAEPDAELEEEFTSRLLACDEALASGVLPASLVEGTTGDLRSRLLRGLACVQRLQQLRPRQPPAVAADSSDAFPARIGRFEILCLLGRGGFGMVYRAFDPALCREVALKIPRADALVDAECRARFQREARAAAGLDHANLVPVHEAGQLGPICYIAFAYCPGSDLATWLKQRTTPVRCADAARLVWILARAIHYAHGRGVLHRDLKPSNVLLSPVALSAAPPVDTVWHPEPDSPWIPRVTDFGLAKLAVGDQTQTKTGDLLGTPSYMAPEQADGRQGKVGPATEVYALGVILYEVVTGRRPFWAETAVETLLQVKTIEPLRPSRLRPGLPRDLETICLKCLEKEPWKRYASAGALGEDLGRFLAGSPIEARPTGRAEQLLKWARRHPALATSLTALLLVTVLGMGGILAQWYETQTALADEARAKRDAVTHRERAERAQQAEARERERSDVSLYHHRVVLAHHEWLAGNVGLSAQLLDRCRPDLRNWEWRYVRRLCDSALFTCLGHSTHVMSVAFSPDGRYLASASGKWSSNEPGEVKLWNAKSGELLWTGLGHTCPVMAVAFSPDGRTVISATTAWGAKAREIKIWDTATGKPLATRLNCPSGVFGLAYSPDGSRLATAGADARVRLWDTQSGAELFVLEGHKANVFSVAFSPDGRQLASAGWDGSAIIWDLASKRALHSLSGPTDLRSVAFSPNGKLLVTASYDHSVKIWEAASGRLLLTYWGHRSPVLCATFAPNGRGIVSTDSTGFVHIWDAESGRICQTVRGHTGAVTWAAFSPDGSRLATAGRDRTVRIWDITREQDSYSLPEAKGALSAVFSPSGRLLAASGYSQSGGNLEKRVRVWEIDKPDTPRFWSVHAGWVRCVAFSPDGKLLASGGADHAIRLWDVEAQTTTCVLDGHADMVIALSFSRDGKRFASASLDKNVFLWNVGAAPKIASVLSHPHPVHDVAFSRDGKRLVTAGRNGMVFIWDAQTGAKLHSLPGHRDIVERGVFSPDGRWLATAGSDKEIRVWDLKDLDCGSAVPAHVLVGHTDRISGLCFTPDGKRLASTGADQTIRLWDVLSGGESLTLRGHPDTICCVTFSPDGRLLVSASARDIKVWDSGAAATPVDHTQH
jgi:eukaryotic-like serine/threonine-protein kinase